MKVYVHVYKEREGKKIQLVLLLRFGPAASIHMYIESGDHCGIQW